MRETPLLLPREDGEEEQEVGVEIRAAGRDRLGGGDHALHVAVVRHAVEPHGERPDVLLDALARPIVQGAG
jgi:hypothetical protein